jgi:hypothetical protein
VKSLKIKVINIFNALAAAFKKDIDQHADIDIPENISTAFLIKYPHAGATKWRIENDLYIAAFGSKNNGYEAFYNADARWLKTEMKIPLTRKLPTAINRSLKIGEFAAWYVKEIKKLEMRDQYLYVIHVDSGNLLDKRDNKF